MWPGSCSLPGPCAVWRRSLAAGSCARDGSEPFRSATRSFVVWAMGASAGNSRAVVGERAMTSANTSAKVRCSWLRAKRERWFACQSLEGVGDAQLASAKDTDKVRMAAERIGKGRSRAPVNKATFQRILGAAVRVLRSCGLSHARHRNGTCVGCNDGSRSESLGFAAPLGVRAVRTCKAPALTVARAGALLLADPGYGVCVMRFNARFDTTKLVNVESTVSTWL